ncbi:MAG: VWA domain-containing protein, partial [Bernardetiaceae bacterium]
MKILLCLSILWLLLTGCQQFARKADNQPEYENNQGQSPPITSSNPSPSIGYAEEIRERVASTEEYDKINETGFVSALQKPLSTFSIDVDGASYSNARRFLERGQLPPPDAVRVEEFINYFDYDYPDPTGKDPFSVTTGMMLCPWNPEHQLIQIGIQGKKLEMDHLAASNLVFLIDVSGSMQGEGRLPLVKESLKLLLDELQAEDKVAIVVYASASGLVLPSTPVSEKDKIMATLDRLEAGGSTAGGEGIEL